jgi:uncharacterized OB-fold protein
MSVGGSGLPTPAPDTDLETAAFWTATAEGRLTLPRCDACGFVIWYPRSFCPRCHSRDVTWIDATGGGTVYSYTIARRGVGEYAQSTPYVLAYVELDEGPRVLTNVVDTDPATIHIGMRVTAVFEPAGERAALVRFRGAPS